MGLNIKNPEAHELAKELSQLMGASMTEAITSLLRERVEYLRSKKQNDMNARKARILAAIAAVKAEGAGHGMHSSDHAEFYDDVGLPT